MLLLVFQITVQLPAYLFCLVFECLLAKCLDTFAEKNTYSLNLQFAFSRGLGACDALLTITSFVQKALD